MLPYIYFELAQCLRELEKAEQSLYCLQQMLLLSWYNNDISAEI